MFEGCENLTEIDISGFKENNIRYVNSMFEGCSNLEHIYCYQDADWSSIYDSGAMFAGCVKLHKFTELGEVADATYARLDGLYDRPGYFELKQS